MRKSSRLKVLYPQMGIRFARFRGKNRLADFSVRCMSRSCRPFCPISRKPPGKLSDKYPTSTRQVTQQEAAVLATARNPATRTELQKSAGLRDREHFVNTCLNPLIEAGLIEMTIPDKPRSSKQKYRLTAKGQAVVKGAGGSDE